MVKYEGKIRKSFILIVFTIVFSVLFLNIISINKKLEFEINKKNENKIALENLKSDLEILKNKQTNLQIEIDSLKNIDENLEKTKKELFSLAKDLETKIKSGNSNYKIAYLTFDDGPYYLTNSFLDILDKYDVKATFFTIGYDKETCFDNRSKECGNMYKKIVDKGHTIANHTYSHSIFNGLYSSVDTFIYDLKVQEELIKNKTGVITNIMRFPGGSAQAKNLKTIIINKLKENNYGWVDWTALNGDGGSISNKTIGWNNFVNSINDNIEVILFHDYNHVTLSMLEDAIIYLQNNNYILLPLFYESVMINK